MEDYVEVGVIGRSIHLNPIPTVVTAIVASRCFTRLTLQLNLFKSSLLQCSKFEICLLQMWGTTRLTESESVGPGTPKPQSAPADFFYIRDIRYIVYSI